MPTIIPALELCFTYWFKGLWTMKKTMLWDTHCMSKNILTIQNPPILNVLICILYIIGFTCIAHSATSKRSWVSNLVAVLVKLLAVLPQWAWLGWCSQLVRLSLLLCFRKKIRSKNQKNGNFLQYCSDKNLMDPWAINLIRFINTQQHNTQ